MGLPKLGVVYGPGSAGAVDLFTACRRLCEPVFIVDSDIAVAGEPPGGVVDVTGLDPAAAGAAVRGAGVEHLVTFSERMLVRAAEIAEQAGIRFVSLRTALLCRDKLAQRRALADAGVDAVRSRALREPGELADVLAEVGLPVVLKPRSGMGSVDTTRADSLAEAQAWLAERTADGPLGELVVEQLLVGDPDQAGAEWGDYVSVESIVTGTDVRHVSVTGKFPLSPPFRETGMVIPGTLGRELEERAMDLAAAAVRALGIDTGVTHTELKLTAEGPRVIEVNARLGGYVGEILRRATGYDLVRAAVRAALGLPAEPVPEPERVAYQYFVQPPADARQLVAIEGAGDLAAIPGVTRFDRHLDAGAPLHWRWGTDRYVGILFGAVESHADVQVAVKTALGTLAIRYA